MVLGYSELLQMSAYVYNDQVR